MQAVKIGWVGQTFAMARCSEASTKGKKTRNRLKKEERKSLVESFINKHREENNGNFPSLNLTHKVVGGSFYTVREIVRELIQENRVLAPGSSHSQVLNLEYSEDRVQPPLGTLSLDPASTLTVEINCHEAYESGGKKDDLHVIEESEKFNDKRITVSSKLSTTKDVITSLHEFSENQDVVFSTHEESSLTDANFSIDSMQTVILECDHHKSRTRLVSVHDISSTKNRGSIVVEELAVLESASDSSISDSIICAVEGEDSVVTGVKTEVTSFMGVEESKSAEISTLDGREQMEIKEGEVEDIQDGLPKLGVTEDLLSSFNSSSCMDIGSGLKYEDESYWNNNAFENGSSAVTEGKKTNLSATRPLLSFDEITQIHSASFNITLEEVGMKTGVSVSDDSNNHPPHTEHEVESLHLSVDDSSKNPIAASEITAKQVDPHIKSDILLESKSPSIVKASGSSLLEGVESDSFRGIPHGPHAPKETNPFVSALKYFFRAFVKFLTSDF